MKRNTLLLLAIATATGLVVLAAKASRSADEKGASVFVTKIPVGYRDWKFISVAHEEGQLNDIRAILGNETAIKAYREDRFPFPEGTIIARLAWNYVPSEQNNKVFGRAQSFVAGSATNVQFIVKDSKKFAASGGWGFGQFDKDGNPADEAVLKTCFPCHEKLQGHDLVFTRYAP